jgi:glycosyltransferase involved in cell wall biosynthesis
MSNCIFYTYAYNAEKTLARTVESVLAQTRHEWVYYLIDNGSTDSTGQIILEYAEKDARIIPLTNKQNHVWEPGNGWWEIMWTVGEDDYLCFLDADDEYKPAFLARMLAFIKKYDLGVAACGSDHINVLTNTRNNVRKLNENMILKNTVNFEAHFPKYYQFMRTLWGKLYKVSVLRRFDFSRLPALTYGGDTLFAIEAFRNADHVGILAESLYKYYISKKSLSYQFDVSRVTSDQILFDTARDFLISKCGEVNRQNENFLFGIYFDALDVTLGVLLNAQMPTADMLQVVHDIFASTHTRGFFAWSGYTDEKAHLVTQITKWLFARPETRGAEMNVAAEVLAVMCAAPPLDDWRDDEAFGLLSAMKGFGAQVVDARLAELLEKSALFKGVNADAAVFLRVAAIAVLRSDLQGALDEIVRLAEDEIPDEYAESFLALAQNICVAAGHTEGYIFFKKQRVAWLTEQSRRDEAAAELTELAALLPDDPEVRELQETLK